MRIVLVTPRRRFIANRFGLGYQMPLGLVFIGGPLADAGHRVRLVDNDVLGWDDERLAREVARDAPHAVLLGHTGSTAAHPAAMRAARALKARMPGVTVVYGGVYPTYHAPQVLLEEPAIDVVVRGEGEETALELAAALDGGRGGDLASVRGIAWRDGDGVRVNADRPPIADLDRFRPGWELVDWDAYRLFGFGRSAGMQFSRGCPLRCSYCGQWGFWRRWRHRSPEGFARELETLARRHGVRIVWLADESFAAEREPAREALERVAARSLGLSLNLNMTAADVLRDADLLPLYKLAGEDNVVMGIESLDDAVVAGIGKHNPFEVSREAVRLLRANGIVSLVNVIYGLEDETPATVRRTFRRLHELDPDVLNAVYLTPHSWTAEGRSLDPARVIEHDLALHTYRNQVIDAPGLSPARLFLSVKLTEVLFHLRPRALARLAAAPDGRYRKVLRAYMATGARVVLAEAWELLRRGPRRRRSPAAVSRRAVARSRRPRGEARSSPEPARLA
ncbi:MAG: radical SAM protein [Planctomycetes bacterium]|nr:radical SAM protein [Planctomycetota bacterium]